MFNVNHRTAHPQAPAPAQAPVPALAPTPALTEGEHAAAVPTEIPIEFKIGPKRKGTPGRGDYCMRKVFGLDDPTYTVVLVSLTLYHLPS